MLWDRTAPTGRAARRASVPGPAHGHRGSPKRPYACTLHAHGYGGLASHLDGCQRKAETQARDAGKRLRVEVLLAGAHVPAAPEPLPVHDLVEADLWDQRALRPAGVARAPATRLSSLEPGRDASCLSSDANARVVSASGRRGQRMPRSAWG